MKLKFLFVFLFFALLISGCGYDEPLVASPYDELDTLTDVWIEVDPSTISSCGTEIIIHNNSDRDDLFTGLWFCIEVDKDGTWFSLPLNQETVGFPSLDIDILTDAEIRADSTDVLPDDSIGDLLRTHFSPNRISFQWEDWYGALPRGDYRLIISLLSKKDIPISETSPKYYLSAPFSIS
jgi:hypothetical protein